MFHLHSSCTPNMKNIKDSIYPKQVSVVNTAEPESIKSNDNDIFIWLSIVWNVIPSFSTVLYNLYTCTNLDGCQKKGGHFLNLLQKERGNEKRGVPSEKGGSTLDETI